MDSADQPPICCSLSSLERVLAPSSWYYRFGVLTELVEHNLIALTHINRDVWDTATTGQPTCMRAKHALNDMADVGIDPVVQIMDGLVHLPMATPGPKEGA